MIDSVKGFGYVQEDCITCIYLSKVQLDIPLKPFFAFVKILMLCDSLLLPGVPAFWFAVGFSTILCSHQLHKDSSEVKL